MHRHVIKGRGENRGKYLCYARMAPKEASTAGVADGARKIDDARAADGFVWLPEQRKAARWADPLYSGRTWATDRARLHNGYFVKLVKPPAVTGAMVDELRAFIARRAVGASEKLACYWFGNDLHDAGENFCRDCAEKLVDKKYAADPKRFEELYGECADDEERYSAAIDGGWDIEQDSTPFCETCGAKLSAYLTEYGSDQEIEALTDYAAPGYDDANGWDALDDALVNVDNDDPRWRSVAKVVNAAKVAEQKAAAVAAALAATPGMSEARGALLSLLTARKEQKAPEPSYRLWDELQAWMRVRHDETPETEATEQRLFKEAVPFLKLCGIRAYMTNGGMGMAEAPHGKYYWPFVVETEQRKLWQDGDLAAGRAVGLVCLASANAPGRGANPFAPDGPEAARARAWDDGFLVGLHEASGESKKSGGAS